ncbi:MAG: hypothetical protein ACLP8S_07085 [Solirubrobacteraceae bacterium]
MTRGVREAPDLNALRKILRQLFDRVRCSWPITRWLEQVSILRESGAPIGSGYYRIQTC